MRRLLFKSRLLLKAPWFWVIVRKSKWLQDIARLFPGVLPLISEESLVLSLEITATLELLGNLLNAVTLTKGRHDDR